MYSNIGKKIQTIAQVAGWAALIIGALVWLVLILNGENEYSYYGYEFVYDTSDDWIGWVTLFTGVTYYVASWFIYGFGQLVDDIHAMRDQTAAPASAPSADPSSEAYNDLPDL